MSRSFNSGTRLDESVIKLVYNDLVKDVKLSYGEFVKSYRLYLLDGHGEEVKGFEEIDSLLKEIIDREHSALPYSGISENDRRAMISIENAVEKDSLPFVKQNLDVLSNSIKKYEKEIKKNERKSAWSFFITFISLLFAVFAFVWGNRVSKQDYNKLNLHLTSIEGQLDTLSHCCNERTIDCFDANEEIRH